MPGLTLLPLGVGDAFSSKRYSSSVALRAEDQWLLLDCPHPIQKMIREASTRAGLSLTASQLSAVALTHLHADHCSGLEGLAFYFYFLEQRRLPLLAHPLVTARLWDGHLSAGMEQLITKIGGELVRHTFADYFEHHALSFERPLTHGPFQIECRTTLHHVPTTAFRIRAGGRMLGYSADTAFDESLIQWLSEADIVVHETNYGIHTPYEKLAALPASLRAKMRLIHYPDDFEVAKSAIEPLEEGKAFEV
jgi:ribonuclease BN (tRNA processing enzyme)